MAAWALARLAGPLHPSVAAWSVRLIPRSWARLPGNLWHPFEILEKDKPIDEIPNLEHGRYLPRGNTPLLDALGDLITYCDERSSKEVIKSDQVVAVFTDGHENASHRWGRQALFNVIEKRKKEGWIFIFMGANQDSYLEAGRLGFDNENIQNYRGDSSGTRMAYSSMP